MRFAYFARPHIGGTYSVFKQLRHGLAPSGIEIRWLSTGKTDVETDERWRAERAIGDALDPQGRLGEKERAELLLRFIEENGLDGVFINVLADRLETNIVRYLPPHVLRFMIVHTITPATYAAAASIRDHVHATIGVSQRCRGDLVSRFGFPPKRIVAIANAVDFTDAGSRPRSAPPSGGLRLLFLGRIDDTSKGVFWLPRLMGRLPSSVRLTVAGDGPDLPKLRKQCAPHHSRVTFTGVIAHEKVRELLAAHDILVMPSRFEGSPMSLIESMATGCIPVASNISGVTDTLVDHGINGMLFPVGDWRQAARHIETIRSNSALLSAMSRAAQAKAESGFTTTRMAASYAALIAAVKADPPILAAPRSLEEWSLPAGLRTNLRTYLPQPVKNWLRLVQERLHTAASST
ncbi:glycosyltransferase family 1 protein [Phyllobacterium salinisoli]|uniref:Glycosyltransferase family 1 protein n=1 Tax=Phyllobacterium salinisoli TaxID=1899321 RepID=A0A368K1X0_9HYPH|nr:glycosyltransferase family 4 protein [Phyllobacterium salinisoli]RCS22665.1 glycosyltransferase family 1 protein [Phyllobacterium salinisoli]